MMKSNGIARNKTSGSNSVLEFNVSRETKYFVLNRQINFWDNISFIFAATPRAIFAAINSKQKEIEIDIF